MRAPGRINLGAGYTSLPVRPVSFRPRLYASVLGSECVASPAPPGAEGAASGRGGRRLRCRDQAEGLAFQDRQAPPRNGRLPSRAGRQPRLEHLDRETLHGLGLRRRRLRQPGARRIGWGGLHVRLFREAGPLPRARRARDPAGGRLRRVPRRRDRAAGCCRGATDRRRDRHCAISDLRTAAIERAPFIASRRNIEEAFKLAEDHGKFRIDDVSPMAAAGRVKIPVILIHGAKDEETPPAQASGFMLPWRAPSS